MTENIKKIINRNDSKQLLLVGVMICMGLFLLNFVSATSINIITPNGTINYEKLGTSLDLNWTLSDFSEGTVTSGHGVAMTLGGTEGGASGARIIANELISSEKITVNIASATNVDTCYLANASEVTLETDTIVGNTCEFDYDLVAGTTYLILTNISGGGDFTRNITDGGVANIVGTLVNWTSGWGGGGTSTSLRNIVSISQVSGGCWYNYNSTNTSVICSSNHTTFTSTTQKNLTFYANNSLGVTTSAFTSWVYKLFQTGEYYVSSTASGATNMFNITFESGSQITSAYLNYKNTNYLGTISSSGDIYTLSKNQVAPSVSSSTNVPFYWNVTRADGFSYLTTSQNQTVVPIIINSTCTGGMYVLYNFTLVDEITQIKINGTAYNSSIKVELSLYNLDRASLLTTYSTEFLRINPASVCINNNLSSGEMYSLDAQIQYQTMNHSAELYHIEDYQLNESSLNQNITLYDLPTENTQKFELLVRDTSYLPVDGALIRIERKYIENGTFHVTEIPKTDAKGVTSASLETDDVIYNFYVYNDGELISSFTNVLAICQTPLVSTCRIELNSFQTGITIPYYEDGDDFNFTLGYNYTSKIITSTFFIPSGEPSLIELVVTREDTLGTAVCSDSLTSASGTLSCLVPSSFGNSTVIAKVYKDGVEQGKGMIKLDQRSSDIFGVILVMLSVFVLMTLIGIGISDNPVITAVFVFVGVLVLFAMNLVQNQGFIGATATILFLAIAIILVIIKAARRT